MANQSVLMGGNPTKYDPTNPIVIFLVQATIVIVFCRILHLPLSKIRQPRVIAEVIGGILLGPTAFGRIPGFSRSIFPPASLPNFNLVANVGLILFLFIVGLEVDMRLVVKNARVALSVGIASLVLPFATGAFVAWILHRQYADTLEKDDFGVFLLFIGTAFSITAFPVLARILTELKLLRVNVGVTVLAAGVGNDVTGWMLLALTIALVNASSGLIALYVILLVIAWVLILFFLVKPAYAWLLRRSSSDSGPTDTMMTLTILLVLASAFYTEIIGVHPIFGAFLVGMIIPHDNGYAVNMTEKIEDLVSVLFLPLYFASSGLKTDIGLLNDGKAWGYTILIIIMATASKVVGSMLAARLNGFLWRESLVVGVLMSCKGLVELIVLNVGLNSGILSQKVFTMFVIMALVTTFLTTPLTLWIYPTAYQHRVARWRDGETDWEGNELSTPTAGEADSRSTGIGTVLLVVNRIEGVAPLLQFTHFFSAKVTRLHLVRILEITDRLSQIIKVSESDDLINSDSLISIFKTTARLVGMRLSYALQIVALSDFSPVLAKEAIEHKADLVVAPWIQDCEESSGNDYIVALLETHTTNMAILIEDTLPHEPEHAMRARTTSMGSLRSMMRASARPTSRRTATAIHEKPIEAERTHVYFPLFQFGKDEVLAMHLLTSLVQSDRVTAHVVFFK
ncbi:Sodium/hydrogen exchanger family-domain-containing protein, partial [Protomyces lactucae-debilis]